MSRHLTGFVAIVTLVAAACSSAPAPPQGGAGEVAILRSSVTPSLAAAATSVRPASPLAELTRELPSALGVPEVSEGPSPVTIAFADIGVASAPIAAVGVEANGEMEIPPADVVGWYEFGVAPGEAGSAVLAAHIAYDGVDGVFRRLVDARAGDRFAVGFDDGSSISYEIVERAQYDKDELPFERVFAKDGPPVVTLITCGGDFQSALSSYQDNVVAYAVPVAT